MNYTPFPYPYSIGGSPFESGFGLYILPRTEFVDGPGTSGSGSFSLLVYVGTGGDNVDPLGLISKGVTALCCVLRRFLLRQTTYTAARAARTNIAETIPPTMPPMLALVDTEEEEGEVGAVGMTGGGPGVDSEELANTMELKASCSPDSRVINNEWLPFAGLAS